MADVGRLAGVSPTAVSFVINGRVGEVSEETRDRVLDAVRELGYRPNRAARGLRTRRSHTIGIVSDPVDDATAVARAVAGAHDAAVEHGSRLVLAHDPGGRGLRAVVEDLLDRQVDALLVAVRGARPDDLTPVAEVPTVLLNVAEQVPGTPAVLPAERQGCRAATELLLAAGHRRIALLVGAPRSWPIRDRLAGHREALAAAGLAYDPALTLPGVDRLDAGYARRYDGWQLGENLAWGTGALASPRGVMAAWMDSPGHRHTILRRGYREVGFGVRLGVPRDDGIGATYTADFGVREK